MICESFEQFEQQYGSAVAEEVLTRICEAAWNRGKPTPGVFLSEVHPINALNHTLEGTVVHNDISFEFLIDNGDANGTVVREFTTEDRAPYVPERPARYTLVPANPHLKAEKPFQYEAFLQHTKQSWFKDLVSHYNYDRHFQPGLVIERHYKEQAVAHGLVWVCDDDPRAVAIQQDLNPPAI